MVQIHTSSDSMTPHRSLIKNPLTSERCLYRLLLGSQRTKELGLLLCGLESSVTKLGAGIDELEVDGLEMLPGRMLHDRLTKDQRTLLDTDNGTLDHDPILADHTIVDESTHGGDALFSQISLGLTTSIVSLLTNTVNLLVHLSTMEITVLTSAGYSVGNTGRMP